MKTILEFLDQRTRAKSDCGNPLEIEVSSRDLGWDGIILEKGYSPYFYPQNIITPYFYFALAIEGNLHWKAKVHDEYLSLKTTPGEIWINPPGIPFSHSINEICFFIIFTIEDRILLRNFDSAKSFKLEFLQSYNIEDVNIKGFIELIYNEAKTGGRNGKAYINNLVDLFSQYFVKNYSNYNELFHSDNRKSKVSREDVKNIRKFIVENIGENLSVENLADRLNMCKFHFLREFKKSTGITPYQFILQEKLNLSKTLLSDAGNEIADIAYRIGFSDQSHFSNQFKKMFGISPGQYRKS